MTSRGRLVLLAALVGTAFVAVAVALPHSPSELRDAVAQAGPLAPALVLGAWLLLTPALFPGTVLAAATGLILGAAAGFGVALAGATLGGLIAFALARHLGAGAADDLTGEKLARLRVRVERRGFVSVALARLAPGVPATALHYVAGLTRIRPAAFAAGIFVGGAPRIGAYTALGGTLDDPTSLPFVALVAALALMGVVPVLVAWRRRATARAAA